MVADHFGRHPDAEIYTSQPGLGVILGARVLAEFGDDRTRFADAKARKNYAGTSPITRASGKAQNRGGPIRPQQAAGQRRAAMGLRLAERISRRTRLLRRAPSPQVGHQAALRQLANRLVGILHGCLKTGTLYDETTAWAHHHDDRRLTSKNLGCLLRCST